MLKKIIKFLLSLLVIVLLLDPSDKIFHLKMPLFILIIFVWFGLKLKQNIKFKKDSFVLICGLLLISFFGILMAVIQNTDIDYTFSIGFLKSLSILFLLLVVIDLDLEIDILVNKFSLFIPFIIIPIYIISFIYPFFFGAIYEYLVLEKTVAMMSNRNYYGYELLMVFYKTSPVLVFSLSFYCHNLLSNKRFCYFLIIIALFICLLISGTRANIIAAMVIIIYYIYQYLRLRRNVIYNILAITSGIIGLVYFLLSLSFEQPDYSADVKSGHFNSFIQNILSNPQYIIWGQGLGSKLHSSGTDILQSQTELTYFDLVRFFGLPLAMIFIFLIVYPIIYLYLNKMINPRNSYVTIAFIMYLFIAGTNPLLISSTGMLILIVMYSFTNKRIYKNIN